MSRMQMQATVTDVEVRNIQKKDGSGTFTLYDVVLDDGSKWTAFDKDLAEAAWNTRGTVTTLEVEVVQKGNYTNKNLRGIGAVSGGSSSFGSQQQTTSFGDAAKPKMEVAFSPEGSNLTPKDISIHRQVATKVAAVLSKSELDFWSNVDTLVRFYETGEKPSMLDALIESGAVQVGTAGIDTPPPMTDDDIPF